VFTQKLETTYAAMWGYFTNIVSRLFRKANLGIAFNVMSIHVDRQRNDLFHVSLDDMVEFALSLSSTFSFQHYGLWEYTTYVYR
jgi:hypothetical protein